MNIDIKYNCDYKAFLAYKHVKTPYSLCTCAKSESVDFVVS